SPLIDHGRFEVLDLREIRVIRIGDFDRFDTLDGFPIFTPVDRDRLDGAGLKRVRDADPSLFAEDIDAIDPRSEKTTVDLGHEIIFENEGAREKFVVSDRMELRDGERIARCATCDGEAVLDELASDV